MTAPRCRAKNCGARNIIFLSQSTKRWNSRVRATDRHCRQMRRNNKFGSKNCNLATTIGERTIASENFCFLSLPSSTKKKNVVNVGPPLPKLSGSMQDAQTRLSLHCKQILWYIAASSLVKHFTELDIFYEMQHGFQEEILWDAAYNVNWWTC